MDVLVVLVGLVGLAGAIWLGVHSRRRARTDAQAQDLVERIASAMLAAHPDGSDAQIIQLIRDELLNRRAREPLLFAWTNAETVGRVRRTRRRAIEAVEQHAAERFGYVPKGLGEAYLDQVPLKPHELLASPHALQVPAVRTAADPFDGTCPDCRQKNDDDAWKCCKCGKILPSAWE
jgi:hypothetical protein